MIANIESIAGFNDITLGGTLVSPEAAQDFDVDEYYLGKDDTTFSFNTTFSINSIQSPSLPPLDQTTVPEGSLTASPWAPQPARENSLEDRKRPPVVRSPFLKTALPIPRFKYDDITITSKDESHAASTIPSDDSLSSSDSHHDNSDFHFTLKAKPFWGSSSKRKQSASHDEDLPWLRRSKRKRKPVDFCRRNLEPQSVDSLQQTKPVDCRRRNLEAPSSDSELVHPCSKGGKLLTINNDNSDNEDCSSNIDSSAPEGGVYEIERVLRQRINNDGEVPCYEYLIRWKPTWEPEEIETFRGEGEGEGAWKLVKILKRRRLDGGNGEILCQWADSWEPEDNVGDDALEKAHSRFRDRNENEKFYENENDSIGDDDDDSNNDQHSHSDDSEDDGDCDSDDHGLNHKYSYDHNSSDSDSDGSHDLNHKCNYDHSDSDNEDNEDKGGNDSDDNQDLDHYQNQQQNDNENNNPDDDDDDEDYDDDDTIPEKYGFEGVLYDTYQEMVDAKIARNKSVLRRIMNQRINEFRNNNHDNSDSAVG